MSAPPFQLALETLLQRPTRCADAYRRTFLSWLHFAVVLGGLAVGLLNFGDKVSARLMLPHSSLASFTLIGLGRMTRVGNILTKQVGKISAAMYTIIAMAVMVYALVVYQMRAKSIRLRTGAPYDDRLGPVSSSYVRVSLSTDNHRPCCVCACLVQSSPTSS